MCSEEKRRRGRRERRECVVSCLESETGGKNILLERCSTHIIREVLYSIQNNIAVGSMKQEIHHFQSIPAHAPVMHFFR